MKNFGCSWARLLLLLLLLGLLAPSSALAGWPGDMGGRDGGPGGSGGPGGRGGRPGDKRPDMDADAPVHCDMITAANLGYCSPTGLIRWGANVRELPLLLSQDDIRAVQARVAPVQLLRDNDNMSRVTGAGGFPIAPNAYFAVQENRKGKLTGRTLYFDHQGALRAVRATTEFLKQTKVDTYNFIVARYGSTEQKGSRCLKNTLCWNAFDTGLLSLTEEQDQSFYTLVIKDTGQDNRNRYTAFSVAPATFILTVTPAARLLPDEDLHDLAVPDKGPVPSGAQPGMQAGAKPNVPPTGRPEEKPEGKPGNPPGTAPAGASGGQAGGQSGGPSGGQAGFLPGVQSGILLDMRDHLVAICLGPDNAGAYLAQGHTYDTALLYRGRSRVLSERYQKDVELFTVFHLKELGAPGR